MKNFVVWERHILDDSNLGLNEGDIPHYFDTRKEANYFAGQLVVKRAADLRCIRFINFSDFCYGIDYGSWSRFLIVQSLDKNVKLEK